MDVSHINQFYDTVSAYVVRADQLDIDVPLSLIMSDLSGYPLWHGGITTYTYDAGDVVSQIAYHSPRLTWSFAMTTPDDQLIQSRSDHPRCVSRYTSHEEGDQFAEGVARRKFRAIVDDRDPKVEVSYDRSRHNIEIAREGEETAEFDDRTARFLFMEHDSETGKIKPAMEWGSPVYYHLAREAE